MKRWIALMLCLVLLLGMMPTVGLALEEPLPLYCQWYDFGDDTWMPAVAMSEMRESAGREVYVRFSTDAAGQQLVPTGTQVRYVAASGAAQGITVECLEANDRWLPVDCWCVRMTAPTQGELRVTLTDGSEQETVYAMPFTALLPDVGAFSSTQRSAESFLGEITVSALPASFYLLVNDDLEFDAAEECVSNCEGVSMVMDPGKKCITVTLGADFAFPRNEQLRLQLPMAGEPGWIRNLNLNVTDARPGLVWCYLWMNNGVGQLPPEAQREYRSDVIMAPGDALRIALFLRTVEDGETVYTPAPGASGDEIALLEPLHGGGNWYTLRVGGFGSGAISAKVDQTVYYLPVQGVLPDVGAYSAAVRSAENYLDALTLSQMPMTFYILADEGCAFDPKGTYNMNCSGASLNFAQDGKSIAVTLSADFALNGNDSFLQMELPMAGDQTWHRGLSLSIVDLRPALTWCHMWMNGDEAQLPSASEREYSTNTIWLSPGGDRCIALFLRTWQDGEPIYTPVTGAAADNNIVLTELSGGTGWYLLRATGFGSSAVVATVDQKQYCFPVEITLPSIGAYSGPERSLENYLNELTLTELPMQFYILTSEGDVLDPQRDLVTSCTGVSWETAQDGHSAVVTLGSDFVCNNWNNQLHLELPVAGEPNGWTYFLDLSIQDLRPSLVYCWLNGDGHGGQMLPQENERDYRSMAVMNPGQNYTIALFLRTMEDGEAVYTPVTATVADDSLSLTALQGGTGWYELRANHLGSSALCYTVGETVCRLPVEVALPPVGFYSAQQVSGQTYLTTLELSALPTTIYLLTDEQNVIDTAAEITGNCEDVTVEVAEDGKMATITLGEDFVCHDGNGRMQLNVPMLGQPGWNCFVEVAVRDVRPCLVYCWLSGDGQGGMTLPPEEERDYLSRFNVTPGGSMCVALFLRTWQNGEPVYTPVTGVEGDSRVSVTKLSGGGNWYELRVKKFGTAAVSAVVSGTEYSLPVFATLPDLGFYSGTQATEQSYLTQFVPAEENRTFYLCAIDDTWVIRSVEFQGGELPEWIDEIVVPKEGARVIPVTINELFDYERCGICLRVRGTFTDGGNFDFYVDIEILRENDRQPGLPLPEGFERMYAYDEEYDDWYPGTGTQMGMDRGLTLAGDAENAQETLLDGSYTYAVTDPALGEVRWDSGNSRLAWITSGKTVEVGARGFITAVKGDKKYALEVHVSAPGQVPGSQAWNIVSFRDTEYTIGLSLYERGQFTVMTGGSGFNGMADMSDGFTQVVYIGAIANGTQGGEAPQALFDCVSNVSITVVDCDNQGTGIPGLPNMTASPVYTAELGELRVPAVTLHCAPGMYATATLQVSFDVTIDEETRHFSQIFYCFYGGDAIPYLDTTLDPEISATVDTAAGLNAILASDEALLNWVETYFPTQYQEVLQDRNFVDIVLPCVAYDGIIAVSPAITHPISLCGSSSDDGAVRRTTMPGLRIGNNFDRVHGIDFVADPAIKQSFGGEEFTCGILCTGTDYRYFNGNGAAGPWNCRFVGFDYGIRTTSSGYYMIRNNTVFENCTYGIYIDSAETLNVNWDSAMFNGVFLGCDTAVKVVSLPTDSRQEITPYKLRFYLFDFVDNAVDFDVAEEGVYYFYCNYYGSRVAPQSGISPENCKARSARVNAGEGVVIVTEPSRSEPCCCDDSGAVGDLGDMLVNPAFKPKNPKPYHLVVDGDRTCRILNSMADVLVFDRVVHYQNAQNNAISILADEDARIDVVDNSGLLIGRWSLPETPQSELNTQAVEGFNAKLLVDRSAEDGFTVEVVDSSLLAQCEPTLSLACLFDAAFVTLNGNSVESTLEGGVVTFHVTQGGVYTISASEPVSFVQGSRAHVAWFLWNLSGRPASGGSQPVEFRDVPTNAVYYPAVAWAVNAGIIRGYENATFGANNAMTRAEFATLLYRYHKAAYTGPAQSPFVDVASELWYYNAICWAVAEDMMRPVTETTFSPNAPISQADIRCACKEHRWELESSEEGTISYVCRICGAQRRDTVTVEDGVVSGTCGDTLTWTVDTTGTLTISGDGALEDYSSAPWKEQLASVQGISLGDGVSEIRAGSLKGCTGLTHIILPAGVSEIEQGAFSDCDKLEYVFYKGTKAAWDKLQVGQNNDNFTEANVRFVAQTETVFDVDVGAAVIPEETVGYVALYDGSGPNRRMTAVAQVIRLGGKLLVVLPDGGYEEMTASQLFLMNAVQLTPAGAALSVSSNSFTAIS